MPRGASKEAARRNTHIASDSRAMSRPLEATPPGASPENSRRRAMHAVIGVMGSADPALSSSRLLKEDAELRVFALGMAIAVRGCTLVTDGSPGLPYAAVQGAEVVGGRVIGISPGRSLREHVHKHHAPVRGFDLMLYPGSGLMGRALAIVRSSDIVVLAGGRSGTMGEFAIARDRGKLIGVLQGAGDIADAIEELGLPCDNERGACVLCQDDDPVRLINRLLEHCCANRVNHSKHANHGTYSTYFGYSRYPVVSYMSPAHKSLARSAGSGRAQKRDRESGTLSEQDRVTKGR